MSNSTQMDRVLDGMLNFNAETKETLDSIKETIDKVFNKHYQANHIPYAVMSFEDEYHYWEEQLAEVINRVEYSDYDVLEPKGVEMLQRRSYVIVRGNLKSGNTIHFDETKFNQLYINGERYTGDYTFNGETPETYERLVVVAVQTPFNLGVKDYGNLEMTVADFPIENAEIFANVGTYSNLQPVIEELLETETAESFYIKGDWEWRSNNVVFINTLKTLDDFSLKANVSFQAPSLRNLIIPNVSYVAEKPATNVSFHYSLKNIDINNVGNIGSRAFQGALINGHLNLTNSGYLGERCFGSCRYIEKITIGNKVTQIGINAFAGCSSVKELIIGDVVTKLEHRCFEGCTSLEKIHLGKSITSVVSELFTYCSKIQIVTVSKGYHCPSIVISNSTLIDWRCFKDVLENCANVGEDGRTAATMKFIVASNVRTELTNAYNSGDEIALAIYDLMSAKSISITT